MDTCPLCGKGGYVTEIESTIYWPNGSKPNPQVRYRILFCSGCQLRFSQPMKDPAPDFYMNGQFSESHRTGKAQDISPGEWRIVKFLDQCKPLSGQRLLDIGCNDGSFMDLARTKGIEVFGIDLDPYLTAIAKDERGLDNVATGSWERLREFNNWRDFDFITIFEVLEHVANPLALTSCAYELLKPQGTICVTVPRFDRFPLMFDSIVDYPPHHFTLWTAKSLELSLQLAGFRSILVLERPLQIVNLYSHAIWWIRKLTRKNPKNRYQHKSAEGDPVRSTPHLASQAASLKGVVKPVLYLSVPFLKGHTLMAIATKQ